MNTEVNKINGTLPESVYKGGICRKYGIEFFSRHVYLLGRI